jgi:predicted dehydrogenase
MIARAGLDAVIVATPHDLHHPITMAALEAGLHVLCEKPLAMNAAQAREMLVKAEAKGVVHMVNFTWRWLPVHRYALRLVQEGYIGRWYRFEARYLAGYARGADFSWHFDPKRSLGVIGEMGCHMIDLARLIVGEFERVFGHSSTFVRKRDPEGDPVDAANDSATLLLDFAGGAQGMIGLSAAMHSAERFQEQHLVLYGEEGTIETDMTIMGGMAIRGARHDEKSFRDLPVPADILGTVDGAKPILEMLPGMFQSQPIGTRLFIDSIIGGTPAVPGFRDGVRVQEAIDAAFASQRRGCWVAPA